jgi:aspartate aminotransferase-like enzyme
MHSALTIKKICSYSKLFLGYGNLIGKVFHIGYLGRVTEANITETLGTAGKALS